MGDLSAFLGPNAGYVLDLYDRYLQDPASVDAESRAVFERIDPAEVEALTRASSTIAPEGPAPARSSPAFKVSDVVGAAALAQAIRD
ncbi:MAG: hypothetical protein KC442_07475, partial [Thermomicrobiales bacterium]|nr:hypothetical protein [Thermomicrobiales bacterium]